MRFSPKLIELLGADVCTVALTGAGISAESGVPTFRGDDGLWRKHNPAELATMAAFRRDPKLVWEWYLYRRSIICEAEPNLGHRTLAEMDKRLSDFILITQNVDNLHRLAGSERIIEMHGSIARNKCVDCNAPLEIMNIDPDNIPRCACGGLVRPDVVWFGEQLPGGTLDTAIKQSERAELFFSIGTLAVVFPAAALPILSKISGAYLVEINPEPTTLTPYADEVLSGKSGEILPAIWQEVTGKMSSKWNPRTSN